MNDHADTLRRLRESVGYAVVIDEHDAAALDAAIAALEQRPRSGTERHELDACVWRRDSTQKWVLEISGTINDCEFVARHTEPLTTAPEDVAGLPSLYAALKAGRSGEAVAFRYSDRFSGKLGMPKFGRWLDIADYHHHKDGVRVEGLPPGMAKEVQFAYAAPQQPPPVGVTVDEAAARRLDDYLGAEFDIRIGKQAAHAALEAALSQQEAAPSVSEDRR